MKKKKLAKLKLEKDCVDGRTVVKWGAILHGIHPITRINQIF